MSVRPEFKIIADHLRSSSFLIADGVMPSNEGRGYVLRRIMRRAMLQLQKLGVKDSKFHHLFDILEKEMSGHYPELTRAKSTIKQVLKDEEDKFRETLERGLNILDQELESNKAGKVFSGEIAFKLYDTYGFPLDLTENILKDHGLEVDIDSFQDAMKKQKDRARQSWSGSGEIKEDKIFLELEREFGVTKFLGLETTASSAKILAIRSIAGQKIIILDQTPFYPTSGGQKGDDGNLVLISEVKNLESKINYQNLSTVIDIAETRKYAGGLIVHFISDQRGLIKEGDQVYALVNNRNRQFRAQNHSATHLLHKALKETLGNSISQKGSLVDARYLTFDFNFNRKVSDEEIEKIEDLVNFYIRLNSPVQKQIMDINEAMKTGAEALFGEKYGSNVRVVSMGPSIELCGGTHVNFTGNIGVFKIISESGIAASIRRITAKTGFYALQHFKLEEKKLSALLNSLKIKPEFDDINDNISEFHSSKKGFDQLSYFAGEDADITSSNEDKSITKIVGQMSKIGSDLLAQIKNQDKLIKELKKKTLLSDLSKFRDEKISDINLLYHVFSDVDANSLREAIVEVKSREQYSQKYLILFFAKEGDRITICLSASEDIKDKFDASVLIKHLVLDIGGNGGGGKNNLAMGGGSNPARIDLAIKNFKERLLK